MHLSHILQCIIQSRNPAQLWNKICIDFDCTYLAAKENQYKSDEHFATLGGTLQYVNKFYL